MSVIRMNDLDLRDQRVLIREDLNVPIDDRGQITSTQRLDAALPTIRLRPDSELAAAAAQRRWPAGGAIRSSQTAIPEASDTSAQWWEQQPRRTRRR